MAFNAGTRRHERKDIWHRVLQAGLFWLRILNFGFFMRENCSYKEKPQRGGSNMYPQSMFWSKNKKNIKKFLQKMFMFYSFKNPCILHGQVFVMNSSQPAIAQFLSDLVRVPHHPAQLAHTNQAYISVKCIPHNHHIFI